MHETQFVVRSTQVDLFGHLNNAAFLEIFEWARWEWAESRGMKTIEMIEKEGIGPAILHVDLSFHKEIRLHEKITVRTWSHSLERIKGVIAQEMIKADGGIASSVRFTFVLFDLKTRKVVSMTEEMRKLHEQDEEYRQSRSDLPDRLPPGTPGPA